MRKIWSSRQQACSCSLSASADLEIGAERLLDDQSTPAVGLVREAGLEDGLGRVREHTWRQREVEDRGTVDDGVQRAQGLDGDVAAVEVDAFDEALEVLLVDVGDVVGHGRRQLFVELLVRPLLARVSDDAQIREALTSLERQQRGEQQAGREVTGCAEDDECRTSHAASVRATMPPMSLRLGINLGYQDWANGLPAAIGLAQRAESLGFHSGWTAEAYGTDAVTPLTWLMAHTERMQFGPAIMQMPARTPAMTAMTAATLDGMSGGRFLLGLGASGPQVAEGWHGQAYGKPLVRTREYVEIVREILKREKPLEHHGEHYDIPYRGADATGLGKPLKIIVHPRRADIPIYLAAIGPKNVALAAEIADGWLPIFFSPYRVKEAFGDALDAGFARRAAAKVFRASTSRRPSP